jgi:hypothetical protein
MEKQYCYTVVLSKQKGSNIGIITVGEGGYSTTDLDWGNANEAQAIVRHANEVRGIDAKTQLEYEMKSMFVWGKENKA